jgi:hypothetical protein
MAQDNPVAGALTADCVRNYELGNVVEYPIDAAVCIYQGSPVIMDGVTPGFANVPETAAGAGTFVGFAIRRRDNRVGAVQFIGDAPGSGLAGALRVRVNDKGKVVLWVAGSPTKVGVLVYCSTSDTFTITKPASGAAYPIGRIAEFTSDAVTNSLTRCVVEYSAFAADVVDDQQEAVTAPVLYAASGAIALPTLPFTDVLITKAGVAVMTLALPTTVVDDGKRIRITSNTAFAHTVTTPASGFNGATHIATFAAAVSNNVLLEAQGGTWNVIENQGVTLS